MRIVIAMVALGIGGTAQASPSVPAERAETETELAVAVNAPFRWADTQGASIYLGFTPHQAIRANFARYQFDPNPLGEIIGIALGGDGSEASFHGTLTDVGVGWMYFPRRLWSGLTLEAGALRRARDHSVEDQFAAVERVETRTATYAGRALIGWSWLFGGHGFISIAGGISIGRESGSETTTSTLGRMPITHDVTRTAVGGEGFLRIGGAFDL
jgi:hypothetical protein